MIRRLPKPETIRRYITAAVNRASEAELRDLLEGGWPSQRDWLAGKVGTWSESFVWHLKQKIGKKLNIL